MSEAIEMEPAMMVCKSRSRFRADVFETIEKKLAVGFGKCSSSSRADGVEVIEHNIVWICSDRLLSVRNGK